MTLREVASLILIVYTIGGSPVIDMHATVSDMRDFRIATTGVTQPVVENNVWTATSTVLQVGDLWVWEHEWYPYPEYEYWENSDGPDLWLGGEIVAAECGRPSTLKPCTIQIKDLRETETSLKQRPWGHIKQLYKEN